MATSRHETHSVGFFVPDVQPSFSSSSNTHCFELEADWVAAREIFERRTARRFDCDRRRELWYFSIDLLIAFDCGCFSVRGGTYTDGRRSIVLGGGSFLI